MFYRKGVKVFLANFASFAVQVFGKIKKTAHLCDAPSFYLFDLDIGLLARRGWLSEFDASVFTLEAAFETAEQISSTGDDDGDQQQQEQPTENHAE